MILGSVFTKGVILQRNKTIPVWGVSLPYSIVECEIAGKRSCAATSATGRFMIHFPALEAGGPYTLSVVNLNGEDSAKVEDVMVGEVWLVSGQSNMEFKLKKSPKQHEEFCREELESSMIRMLTIPQIANGAIEDTFEGTWLEASRENAGDFSAVALWFALSLQKRLRVPVGIINASWGGTNIEAWTSRGALMEETQMVKTISRMDEKAVDKKLWTRLELTRKKSDPVDIQAYFHKYCKEDSGNTGYEKGWAAKVLDDSSWHEMKIPGSWITEEYGSHGAVWMRKRIIIPGSWKGKKLTLTLCGIDKHDVTYFNGVKVGSMGSGFDTACWNVRRKYDIDPELVKDGEAVIAVRAYSFALGAGFYGAPEECALFLDGSEEKIPLAGIWKFHMEYAVPEPPPLTPNHENLVPGNANNCGILYDSMIHPLIPFAIKGVLWYQGEKNAESICRAKQYELLMELMIKDWRRAFEQGGLPFIMAGLAGFRDKREYDEKSAWAYLRESQRHTAGKIPDVYIASAVDCGEENDVHPQDKRTVGERMELIAAKRVYGADLEDRGPEYKYCCRENGAVRLFFSHGKGMHALEGEFAAGFYIADADRSFYKAEAKIEGETILVSSVKVRTPVYIRYNWSDHPVSVIVNASGLPAFPFEAEAEEKN